MRLRIAHRWWDEPERFRPTRFEEAANATRKPHVFLPFGAGTRICIGEHFAWMEGMLVLATIAQRWRLRYEGATPPAPQPLVTLRPRDGLAMRLIARRGATAGTS